MLRIGPKILFLLSGMLIGCAASKPPQCALPKGILQKVSSLRGLPALADVPCLQTKSTSELREILSETIEKRLSSQEVQLEGQILKLLGIIPNDYNYREEIISQYAQRLSAFYSPEFKRFVLSKDLGDDKGSVLAHELTHAIQDQSYDLNKLTDVNTPSDTVLARTAIFEGDANLLMKRFSGTPFCQGETLEQQIQRLDFIKNQKSDAPMFFELQMAFPYLVGEQYLCDQIAKSRKSVGGGLNETLQKIYQNLPLSTAELVGLPASKVIKLPDPKCIKADSYGLFGISSIIASEISIAEAIKLLNSYTGDKICLTKDGEKFKLEWNIKLTKDRHRRELKSLLSNYFSKKFLKGSYLVRVEGGEVSVETSQ
jgi:hypothetical protein